MVASNPNVPHVDTPLADPQSLVSVLTQLKQGVESLGGHRGGPNDRAVTFNDLISLTNRVTVLEGAPKSSTTPATPTSNPSSDIAALQASVTDLSNKVAAHDVSIVTLNYQMAQTTDQISYQQGLINTLNSQMNDMGVRVYNLEVHVANIDSEISNLSSRVSSIEGRLAAAGIP